MRTRRILNGMHPPDGLLKTVDDYRKLDVEHGIELIEGEFVVSPSPDARHQSAVVQITSILNTQVRRLNLGRVFVAPFDVVLSKYTVVQPDVLFLTNTSLARIERWLTGPPDLAVEFLSRSNPAHDLTRKLELYRAHGVPEYWIGDPEAKTLVIRRLSGKSWSEPLKLELQDAVTSPLMPGVTAMLAEIYAE